MDNLINYDEIINLVQRNSRVLDLGSGDGYLLEKLRDVKSVSGVGIEINQEFVIRAIEKGLSIIQGNIDEGLKQFGDKSFDFVILNRTLQSTFKPEFVIEEMLRVGKKCIVSFPNFANWRVRFYLLSKGKMPKSKLLPYEWYNTPNIHLLTISDFFDFCKKRSIKIKKQIYFTEGIQKTSGINFLKNNKHIANFFSTDAIFVIQKED